MVERIVVSGKAAFLKPVITEILALHQLIENRDIGQFVGATVEEYVRPKPRDISLRVLLYSTPYPPWRANLPTERFVTATYNIPDVKRSLIDWERIKTACGGTNGYMWGRFRTTANLSNGRQMQVHGATKEESEDRLRALVAFSEAEIATLSTTEELKEGRRATDKQLYKESTRVYPAYFTVLNQIKIVTETNTGLIDGNYKRQRARIPLWVSRKPSNADALIAEALRVRGAATP